MCCTSELQRTLPRVLLQAHFSLLLKNYAGLGLYDLNRSGLIFCCRCFKTPMFPNEPAHALQFQSKLVNRKSRQQPETFLFAQKILITQISVFRISSEMQLTRTLMTRPEDHHDASRCSITSHYLTNAALAVLPHTEWAIVNNIRALERVYLKRDSEIKRA